MDWEAVDTTSMDFSRYDATRLPLVGGHVALDFVNTVDWRLDAERCRDWLGAFPELIAWGLHAGLLKAEEAETLARQAEGRPAEAAAALSTARVFREALFRIIAAGRQRRTPATEDLEFLNAVLGRALGRYRVVSGDSGFTWECDRREAPLEYPLYPLARAAAELLVSPQLFRVRQCADEACGWLFLDGSKNGSRRWCSMSSCGNRAKARRHYRRARGNG